MNYKTIEAEFERCRLLVEEKLATFFTDSNDIAPLTESMRYSLLAGGKRIRPIICLKFCEAAGGGIDHALYAACAVEMLHTYSLIHDDLPCMDNDAMRRGKPSNHVKFGEFTATLAGDALQAAAFETLLYSDLPAERIVYMAKLFANAAGPNGICGGQYLDMIPVSGESENLIKTYQKKTGSLIAAAAGMGVIAGGGSERQVTAAGAYGHFLGLAFQIRDDILDITATEKELGKPIGSDKSNNKTTFATALNTDISKMMISTMTESAIGALEGNFENKDFLIWLAKNLADRKF